MAASATFALKAGEWFRRGRLLIVSPDSRGTACPLSGRNSTYRPVQFLEAGSNDGNAMQWKAGAALVGDMENDHLSGRLSLPRPTMPPTNVYVTRTYLKIV